MPLYDMVCESCGHREEVLAREIPTSCSKCSKPVRQEYSAPSFLVHGYCFFESRAGRGRFQKERLRKGHDRA